MGMKIEQDANGKLKVTIPPDIVQTYFPNDLSPTEVADELSDFKGKFLPDFKMVLKPVPSKSETEITIANSTRAVLFFLGASNSMQIIMVSTTSGGVINYYKIGEEGLTVTTATRKMTIDNTLSVNWNMYALIFTGSVS